MRRPEAPVPQGFVGSNPTSRTTSQPANLSLGRVVEYGFHLRKNGYRESSIDRSVRILRRLSKNCLLEDAEAVKTYLSTLDWSLGTKEIASNVLDNFYKLQGIPFSKPRYR